MWGEEALYKWIGSVLDAAAKDPEVMKMLQQAAPQLRLLRRAQVPPPSSSSHPSLLRSRESA